MALWFIRALVNLLGLGECIWWLDVEAGGPLKLNCLRGYFNSWLLISLLLLFTFVLDDIWCEEFELLTILVADTVCLTGFKWALSVVFERWCWMALFILIYLYKIY